MLIETGEKTKIYKNCNKQKLIDVEKEGTQEIVASWIKEIQASLTREIPEDKITKDIEKIIFNKIQDIPLEKTHY